MQDYRMETFLTLCETKSYTKTAALLHLSQPSVTAHIQFLEQFYGCPLIRYENRQVEMTAAGEYLRSKAVILRAQEAEIQKHLSTIPQQVPQLEVGITPTAVFTPAMQLLCSVPNANAATMPSVRLHVAETRALLQDLQNGQLDAAVLEGEVPTMQMEETELYRERMLAVSSVARAKAYYGCAPQQLLQEPLLLMQPGCGLRGLVRQELRKRGISFYDFASLLEVDSFWVMHEMLQQGKGIAFLLECIVARELEENRLGRIYLDTPSMYGKISFVSMRKRIENDSVAALRHLLLQTKQV